MPFPLKSYMRSYMETVAIIAVCIAFAGAVVAVVVMKKSRRPSESLLILQQQLESLREQLRASLDSSSKLVNQQISDLTNQLQTQIHRQTGALNDTRKSMDERLDNAARVIGDVQKSMGRVHEALIPVGELRDILKAPKLRGGMGEIILERLLEEMLPANLYAVQHNFSDNERVDAVIKLGGQIVPIDSKFPMDKYREYLDATTDEARKTAKKSLSTAVKKHITDVAKYIRPDEGTYPFAFMYIPSENIYYEMFVSAESDNTLWAHAAATRVFPVSSNTLYIYLQTISFGLKGMQIAEHARDVLNQLEQLQKTIGDFRKNYEKIGTHLKNAQNAYGEAEKRLDKVEMKFTTINTEAPKALAEPTSVKEDNELIQ